MQTYCKRLCNLVQTFVQISSLYLVFISSFKTQIPVIIIIHHADQVASVGKYSTDFSHATNRSTRCNMMAIYVLKG